MDQDAKTMHTSRVIQAIYKTLTRMKNMKGDQIHNLTDGERKIVGSLRREGYM